MKFIPKKINPVQGLPSVKKNLSNFYAIYTGEKSFTQFSANLWVFGSPYCALAQYFLVEEIMQEKLRKHMDYVVRFVGL